MIILVLIIVVCILRYDEITLKLQASANITKGRLLDAEFDANLFRLVILFRAKQVKVSNTHIKLLARKLLTLPKYEHSPAHKLKFSNQWLKKWKERGKASKNEERGRGRGHAERVESPNKPNGGEGGVLTAGNTASRQVRMALGLPGASMSGDGGGRSGEAVRRSEGWGVGVSPSASMNT